MSVRVFAVWLSGLALPIAAQVAPQPVATVQSWRVQGRAIDEQGEPIEGVSVALASVATFTTAAVLANPVTMTDAEGRFEVIVEDAWGRLGRGPLLAASGRTTVLLELARPAARHPTIEVGDVVLLPATVVRGRVRTAGGAPLANARVVATDPLAMLVEMESKRMAERYTSAAVTAADGSFELTGVLGLGAAVVVTAAGHHRSGLPFVAPGAELSVDLTPAGSVAGIVRDADGMPCPGARVWTWFDAGDEWEPHVSDEHGRFAFSLAFPHGYRIQASVGSTRPFVDKTRGIVLEGPATDVELTVGPPIDPGHAVVLRTVDATTGKAVEEVRAAALWLDRDRMAGSELGRRFADHAVRRRGPGEVRLPGPGPDDPATGVVLIVAKGYAPHLLADVVWSDAKPVRLEAKLVRECAVAGVVVDPEGTPLPGIHVHLADRDGKRPWFVDPDDDGRPVDILTDANGRFRIGGMPAGSYLLWARDRWRVSASSLELELGPSETRDDTRLELPTRSTVSGKLVGAVPGPRWEVRLRATGANRLREFTLAREELVAPRSPFASGAAFLIPNVPAGMYRVRILIPHRWGRCGWLDLGAGSLRVRATDIAGDIDVGASLPGAIRGNVNFTAAALPYARLVVAAFAPPRTDVFALESPYLWESVAADGSFALPAVPGTHRIEIVDLATRIPLAVQNDVKVESGKTTELPVRIELVPVRIHLKPKDEDGVIVASGLEIDVQHERHGTVATPVTGSWNSLFGTGLALAGRTHDIELLLPTVTTKLTVHSNFLAVRAALMFSSIPLGATEFTPTRDATNRVEIEAMTFATRSK